ncbi:1-acyl-sn-glycerol-3-phosphate acyltransferase [bacterium C-53]|nr:1-acyl-sn-glycerol-3-phosphate acyltransferase [Lachnospiraceae bacterium]NBI03619.1 1-acyl-sn-glycerol-3-phosphate acyltransferase [Lachnospiraceae bacterium]RKJ09385.1 1-acyl-sn-glycerol-3-phosphate acyltransferase [bacterium C-53]
MIRFTLVVLFLFLFLICSVPVVIVEWMIGKLGYQEMKDKSSLAIVNWAFRVVIFLSGTKVHVIGEENVPKDQAVVYIPNHRSYFDIILTYVRVPRPTGYIAKKEMLRYPVLKDWMKNLHCKFLDRNDMKAGMKMILDAIADLKNGISICIFPEGTRNRKSKDMMPFKEGSLKIAEKSGCPIIPVAITNSSAIFEDHIPKIKKAHVIIEYGEPIYTKELSGNDRKFIGAYTQRQINAMLQKHDLSVYSR